MTSVDQTAKDATKTQQGRQEIEKFVVRLPHGMRSRIAEVSRQSHRSMNSEIIARLEESLAATIEAHRIAEGSPGSPPERPRAASESMPASDRQRQQEALLLHRFRRLTDQQRGALLALLSS